MQLRDSIKLDTIGWATRFTGNCARNLNLIVWQMVYAQNSIYLGKYDAQTSLGFWDINGLINLGQTSTL